MAKNTYSDKSKSGLKKGKWTPEEDKKLIAYITRYGHWNWNLLPKFAGLERCGKSCRLRWLNYLRPNIKRGNYTQEEEDTIIKLLQSLGNKWSAIAAQLPGRTDNDIKNYWHTHLKKQHHHLHKTELSDSKHQSSFEVPKLNIKEDVHQNLPPIYSQPTDSCTIATFDTPDLQFAFADAMNESLWWEPNVFDISCIDVPNCDVDVFVGEGHCFSPVPDVELWSHHNDFFVSEY